MSNTFPEELLKAAASDRAIFAQLSEMLASTASDILLGFIHTLPDGVQLHARFKMQQSVGYECELMLRSWCLDFGQGG